MARCISLYSKKIMRGASLLNFQNGLTSTIRSMWGYMRFLQCSTLTSNTRIFYIAYHLKLRVNFMQGTRSGIADPWFTKRWGSTKNRSNHSHLNVTTEKSIVTSSCTSYFFTLSTKQHYFPFSTFIGSK